MPRMPMLSICYFNSRPSARGDKSKNLLNSLYGIFQFTPLREGRPACRSTILSGAPIFQFTPLREGRPALLPIPVAAIQISIHAPPRGATRSGCACSVVGGIFQFTPLREGRLGVVVQPFCGSNFNSRPSARGDDCPECRCYPSAISIHAPPRGATKAKIC